VKTMPTLRSKVMVKAMLMKAPALAQTKVRTRETRGKSKLLQRSKGQSFKLKRHRHKTNWGCELLACVAGVNGGRGMGERTREKNRVAPSPPFFSHFLPPFPLPVYACYAG